MTAIKLKSLLISKSSSLYLLLLLSSNAALSLETGVTVEVHTTIVDAFELSKQKRIENRINDIDVYALSKSARLLYQGRMLSPELYQKFHNAGSVQDLKSLRSLIASLAHEAGLEWELIAAIVKTESSFDPNARSSKGAQGLMQLMPATSADLGVKDPLDPKENLTAGISYFKSMLARFNTLDLALAAYNAGPYNVEKFKGIPPFEETRNFIFKVKSSYQDYKRDGFK